MKRDTVKPNSARPKYENDDYSQYSDSERSRQSDYSHEYGGSSTSDRQHPGVSGKSRGEESWINREEYNEQRSFMGKGPKGYKRSDDRIYEEVCEALLRSHEVNAEGIGVKVKDGIVTLEGKVSSRQEKRMAEMTIEDLPGVLDIINEINLSSRDQNLSGHEGAVKKDLGIGDAQNSQEA